MDYNPPRFRHLKVQLFNDDIGPDRMVASSFINMKHISFLYEEYDPNEDGKD